jgi:hypothetical protein
MVVRHLDRIEAQPGGRPDIRDWLRMDRADGEHDHDRRQPTHARHGTRLQRFTVLDIHPSARDDPTSLARYRTRQPEPSMLA